MAGRLTLTLLVLPFLSVPASAEELPEFDPHLSTWKATHIVVTEGGKVVESWKGDLKVGDALPEGVAPLTKMPVPGLAPWVKQSGEPAKAVSGKRMVLFLAYAVPRNTGDKKPVWLGANWRSPPREADVVWIEDDHVYSVYQPRNPGGYELIRGGSVAGLKQRVDLGLAVRAQFDAARAEPDLARRVERLAAVQAVVAAYVGYYGVHDLTEELRKCGTAAVPYLAGWAADRNEDHWSAALYALARVGDDAFDAMVKILDQEVQYWKAVAEEGRPEEGTDRRTPARAHVTHAPYRLHSVLQAAHGMRLSARNKERLRSHTGLQELDKVIGKPGMKQDEATMAAAREILRAILAGKSRD
jgi:hypothetical protein